MTLQQLLTFTAVYEPSDVRRSMVAVLAGQRPRRAEEYRRFYEAVCLHLMTSRHQHPLGRRHLPSGSVASYATDSRQLNPTTAAHANTTARPAAGDLAGFETPARARGNARPAGAEWGFGGPRGATAGGSGRSPD